MTIKMRKNKNQWRHINRSGKPALTKFPCSMSTFPRLLTRAAESSFLLLGNPQKWATADWGCCQMTPQRHDILAGGNRWIKESCSEESCCGVSSIRSLCVSGGDVKVEVQNVCRIPAGDSCWRSQLWRNFVCNFKVCVQTCQHDPAGSAWSP